MEVKDFSNSDQDPIISLMLCNRSTSKDDMDAEAERRKRLQYLLKTSKKYRRLSIQFANEKWANSLGSSDIDSSSSINADQDVPISVRTRRVNFSDAIELIPSAYEETIPSSLLQLIKSVFKIRKTKK